jgi:hypothetical protein
MQMFFIRLLQKNLNFFISFLLGLLCLQNDLLESSSEKIINLNKFKKDVYSQCGEDGVIEKIFTILKPTSYCCVEIGAWDGVVLSNTALLERKGWRRIGFEGDQSKINNNPSVFYEWITPKNINSIFDKYAVPRDLDLLSIDIDSLDFYVWAALKTNPKVVIIEHNGCWGLTDKVVSYIEDLNWDQTEYFGASTLNMYRLGLAKGYTFVFSSKCNLIFIKNECLKDLDIKFLNQGNLRLLASLYGGLPRSNKRTITFEEALAELGRQGVKVD